MKEDYKAAMSLDLGIAVLMMLIATGTMVSGQQTNCLELPSLTNGMITYISGSTNNRPVSSIAKHSCNPGYTLTGGTTRTCESDGVWSGSAPVCLGTCSDLPPLMNGGITYTNGLTDSRPINTIATFTCDNGYTLTGGGVRACQNDGTWSGTAQTCQVTIPCSDNLPTISNGAISYASGSTNNRPVGATATYSCDTSYTLIGVSVRACGSDGEWSSTTAPVCQMITCSDLPLPTNGDIDYSAGSLDSRPVDTVATYTCDTGYTLNEDITRTCQANKTWSGNAPNCQPDCRDLPPLTNGMIMYSAGSTNNRPFLSRALHSCNTGYTITGGILYRSAARICVGGGIWNGSPPTCGPCFDLPPLMNGVIAYSAGLADSRPVMTTAFFTCDTGYILTGVHFRACQNDGTWSGSPPTCQFTTCPDLIALTNGMIGYNMGTTGLRPVNTVATLSCGTGFNGINTRTCQADRDWSGSEITCDIYLTLGSTTIATNNTEILITSIGEDSGLPSLTCHTDLTACCRSGDNNGMGGLGQWTFPNGSGILNFFASKNTGQQFFIVRNNPQIIRLARREANNPLTPTGSYCCTVPTTGGEMTLCANLVVCPSSLTLMDGMIFYSDPTLGEDTVATHTCEAGSALTTDLTTRTCGVTSDGVGDWSGSPLVCAGSACPDFTALHNGVISYNTVSANGYRRVTTVATHTCNTGFTLTHSTSTRTCSASGWDGTAPTCTGTCSDLPPLMNGGITYTGGLTDSRPINTVATFTCDNGYTLTGGSFRVCQNDGTWDGPTTPTCQGCPDLTVPANEMISYNMGTASLRPMDTVATYLCDTGYTGESNITKTCGSDGMWSGSDLTCTPIDCGTPPSVSNGSPGAPSPDTMLNGVVTYTCDTGYQISTGVTTAMATCMASGAWGTVLTCQPVNCGSPPSGTNASPETPTSTTLGGTVTYTCDLGYWISRGDITTTATCMASGVWETLPTCQRIVCEAERDSVWWLFFPATLAGFSYSRQQCPQNGTGTTLGNATRFCTLGGVWEAVNTDNCTREVIISLSNMANELFSRNATQNNASQNEVDNLLVSLAEATSVNATGDSTIFPKDLSTTNMIVKSSVKYLVQNVEIASPVSSLNFSEEVMNIFNNVLDERNTGGWERLQEDSAAESQQLLLSAELYGQYVSLALRSEAVDTGNVTEITLVRPNIVLAAMEVDPTSLDDIIFPEVVKVSEETGSAQSTISAAFLAERGSREGSVTAVNILFSNLEDFLPNTNLEMNTTRPVTQVISSQVFSNVKLSNSQTRATFRFTTQKFSENEVVENTRCVFWSVSSDATNSTWSTEGVTTVRVDEDEQMRVYNIVCESSHFTAFAVLVDVTGALNDTTPEIRFALSVVTYAGCSISIFFLLLSIFYFLSLRKELLTKVHYFIHLNLSISLLLGYVVFLSGVETAVANKVACVFVAALLHYLFTTVFFWMLCEGIMLYLMLVVVFNRISKKWWIFFIIGWVVPVIPVAISAGIIHDQYGTKEYCWIAVGAGDKGAIWAFVVPMLLVVLANIFFLLAALRSIYNLKKSTRQQTGKKESLQLFSQLFKATVILLPLLGLTWVFGLLSVNSSTIVFAWLFSIFNSLQGLFVFIFHVLRSEKVTNFLKQCRKRIDSVASTSTSGKYNASNPTSVFHLQRKVSVQDDEDSLKPMRLHRMI